jgi:glutamyl-tRNA synthetase
MRAVIESKINRRFSRIQFPYAAFIYRAQQSRSTGKIKHGYRLLIYQIHVSCKICIFAFMDQKVRVRFAPSPTGGLHLGGVRTALYNYLFARQRGGDLVLRIEDTDQNRYVPGAEEYIMECLRWCGIEPDESPTKGGSYGPYRQSERKQIYRQYAEDLVKAGFAYYAFDSPEELAVMRDQMKSPENPSPQYDHHTRMQMRNSLTLSAADTKDLLEQGVPHVIRFLMPENEDIHFEDMIRGNVKFNTNILDDKVLLKADGMPTYHLAVVVDDYLMKISHVFRGEEWLSSTPLHLLLWKRLGWESQMPRWAHLPLIMKPDGKGKLSKRDGDRLGFPVYAMSWTDVKTGETTPGFREIGFLPDAFINMLALLGWNDGTEQEIFSLQELVEKFSIERVHKGGAKFDFEKAKWFNHEHIKQSSAEKLLPELKKILQEKGIKETDTRLIPIINLIKERCNLLPDLWENSFFFFRKPEQWDVESVHKKWDEGKKQFFEDLVRNFPVIEPFTTDAFESAFKELAEKKNIKAGGLMLPLRVMLVGSKFGPPVFHIAELLGKEETLERIKKALPLFG